MPCSTHDGGVICMAGCWLELNSQGLARCGGWDDADLENGKGRVELLSSLQMMIMGGCWTDVSRGENFGHWDFAFWLGWAM